MQKEMETKVIDRITDAIAETNVKLQFIGSDVYMDTGDRSKDYRILCGCTADGKLVYEESDGLANVPGYTPDALLSAAKKFVREHDPDRIEFTAHTRKEALKIINKYRRNRVLKITARLNMNGSDSVNWYTEYIPVTWSFIKADFSNVAGLFHLIDSDDNYSINISVYTSVIFIG